MKTILLSLLFYLTVVAQSNLILLIGDEEAQFLPSDVTSATLVGWYDFSDATTVFASSNLIDSLQDKSGLGNTVSALTTVRPTSTAGQNGLKVGDFDGGDNLRRFSQSFVGFSAATDEVTYFAVVKFDAINGKTICDVSPIEGTNSGVLFFHEGTNLNFRASGSNNATYAFSDTSKYFLFCGIHAPAARTIYENGVSKNTNSTSQNMAGSPDNLSIGMLAETTTYPINGKIGELIIYRGAISEAERILIETYLNDKWVLY